MASRSASLDKTRAIGDDDATTKQPKPKKRAKPDADDDDADADADADAPPRPLTLTPAARRNAITLAWHNWKRLHMYGTRSDFCRLMKDLLDVPVTTSRHYVSALESGKELTTPTADRKKTGRPSTIRSAETKRQIEDILIESLSASEPPSHRKIGQMLGISNTTVGRLIQEISVETEQAEAELMKQYLGDDAGPIKRRKQSQSAATSSTERRKRRPDPDNNWLPIS